MRRHLNEMTVRNLPFADEGQIDVWDATLPRFGLRIGKQTKTFILNAGKRRITLGRYGVVTLKQARDEAKRRIGLKYLPQTSPQALEVAETYLEAIKADRKPGTINAYSIYLQRLPGLPIHELNPQNLYAALPEGKGAANLCFSTFKAFLSWCVERDHIQTNPLLKRRQPNKLKSRDRLLTDDEIRLIWKESFNHATFGSIVRLLLLSGQRLNQITSLQRTWLQTDQIVFPAYIMKGNIEHTIPLLPYTQEQILALPFQKIEIRQSMHRFREALPQIPQWTLHDFRRYFSSTMASLQVRQEVTEKLLAHRSGGVLSPISQVYNRHLYLNEMRAALTLYEALLQRILEPT